MDLKFPNLKNDLTKRPYSPANDVPNDNIPGDLKTFTEWQAAAQEKELALEEEKKEARKRKALQLGAQEKRERAERYTLLKMGRLIQDNIITAGRLVECILKAANAGRPPEEIALYAVRALALLVNDTMLYRNIADKYLDQYGISMNGKPPYEITRLWGPEK